MSYQCRRCFGKGCSACTKNAKLMSKNLDKTAKPSSSSKKLPDGSAMYMPMDLDKTVKPSSSSKQPSSGKRSSSRPSTSKISSSQRPSSSRIHCGLPSSSGSRVSQKSVYKSAHDIKMASRQIDYESLPEKDKNEQDKWVHLNLQKGLEGGVAPCPAGYAWRRVIGGYRCHGGYHLLTDKVLAEGEGGYYMRTSIDPRLMGMGRGMATLDVDTIIAERLARLGASCPGSSKWEKLSADGEEWLGPLHKGDDVLMLNAMSAGAFQGMPKRFQGPDPFSRMNQFGGRR